MIIFHEGLPGSGKSYEAMIRHVLPALQSGRKVFCFVDGINHQRVSEVAQMELADVQRLLVQLSEDDLKVLPQVVDDNSFVVLDEAQNYWPTGRQKLTPEMMKFITEHRHRGLDLLLMGQLMKDVHPIWRGRVSQKCVFNKLDAIGAEKRYTVIVYKAVTPEKFQKVTQSFGTYDPAKFGMYASHVSDAISTTNYKDSRATVWGASSMKYGIPIVIVVGCFAGFKAWKFFHPDPPPSAVAASPARAAPSPPARDTPPPESARATSQSQSTGVRTVVEAVKLWNTRYRPRIDAQTWTVGGKRVQRGAVEWYDESERVQERLTFDDLARQGVQVVVADGAALVGGVIVTSWRPLEPRKAPYGAQAENGQPSTTSGRAGLP